MRLSLSTGLSQRVAGITNAGEWTGTGRRRRKDGHGRMSGRPGAASPRAGSDPAAKEGLMYRTCLENGGMKLAQMCVEANQNAKDDADLRIKFAAIHEYALAVLREADNRS